MNYTLIEKDEWAWATRSSFIKKFCWEHENCIAAGHYLSTMLWPLGEVRLVGSAKKGKAYYQTHLHDIDAVLFTKFDDSGLISDFIYERVKGYWSSAFELDLDIFCYGNFKRHIRRYKLPRNRMDDEVNLNIYFNPPGMRIWEYLRTITWKYLHSRCQRSRKKNVTPGKF